MLPYFLKKKKKHYICISYLNKLYNGKSKFKKFKYKMSKLMTHTNLTRVQWNAIETVYFYAKYYGREKILSKQQHSWIIFKKLTPMTR